ncbi:MAG TPA: TonB family protein [Alphaproteobacteria bacterium]|nr:TonB family protein [Alphaproteobacteria bacterium]
MGLAAWWLASGAGGEVPGTAERAVAVQLAALDQAAEAPAAAVAPPAPAVRSASSAVTWAGAKSPPADPSPVIEAAAPSVAPQAPAPLPVLKPAPPPTAVAHAPLVEAPLRSAREGDADGGASEASRAADDSKGKGKISVAAAEAGTLAALAPSAGSDAPLDAIHNPPPEYPALARQRGFEGRTLLRVEVAPDGGAREVEVLESSGYSVLDEAAREAVARWRFAHEDRGAASEVVEVPIVFRLE